MILKTWKANDHSRFTLKLWNDEGADCPRDFEVVTTFSMQDPRNRLSLPYEPKGDETIDDCAAYVHVYILDHSGIQLMTADQVICSGINYDLRHCGVVFVTWDKARETWGNHVSEEEIVALSHRAIEQELEYYNTWSQGLVVGFTVEDEEGVIMESVGGFYDSDFAELEAEAFALAEDYRLDEMDNYSAVVGARAVIEGYASQEVIAESIAKGLVFFRKTGASEWKAEYTTDYYELKLGLGIE